MNLAKHEPEINEPPSTLLVSTPKKEKRFLSIQELIAKVKEFTIEVYGGDVHDFVVEEIRDHHGSYGTHIQVSFQLPASPWPPIDSGSEPVYEKRKKAFKLHSKTGIIDSMQNIK
ncbi:MAG: hypothetical protein QM762_25080 [Chryseolinea sp.]